MANPEHPIVISLPQNRNLIRKAAGVGIELINPSEAAASLTDFDLLRVLAGQIRISQDPDLYGFIGGLRSRRKNVLSEETPTPNSLIEQVSQYVSLASGGLKRGAINGSLSEMGSTHIRNAEGVILFYDISVGIDLIPAMIKKLEQLKAYNQMEGINDENIKTILREYEEYPPKVIAEAVAAHTTRFSREKKNTGIYVPEFINTGVTHGQILFTNMYDRLR